MSRLWRIRVAQLVGVLAAAFVVLRVLDRDPEPFRLALLVTVACAAAWLAVDVLSSTTAAPGLDGDEDTPPTEAAVDPRTDALARMIDAHQQARHHDRELHARLCSAVDQRLAHRRGLRRDLHHDEVRELLGHDVLAVLASPSRRLSLTDIETTLQRIEAL